MHDEHLPWTISLPILVLIAARPHRDRQTHKSQTQLITYLPMARIPEAWMTNKTAARFRTVL